MRAITTGEEWQQFVFLRTQKLNNTAKANIFHAN